MAAPYRELAVDPVANARGLEELRAAEASGDIARLRDRWWDQRRYVYVTPGDELIGRAVGIFPRSVRAMCARSPFRRFDARSGGGFYPDENGIWLAAGVETYEGIAQVALSARHELFHYVNWNDAVYRADMDRGWPGLRAALAAAKPLARGRYADWIARSFLPQGDHANIVEYFADIPTNFPDPVELPPPIARYFGALLVEGAEHPAPPSGSIAPISLDAFHALVG